MHLYHVGELFSGTGTKKVRSALSPPADAPMPTTEVFWASESNGFSVAGSAAVGSSMGLISWPEKV